MVKSHDLANQLGPLRHQTLMDCLVNGLKTMPEGLVHVADSVELCIIRTLYGAIIADKLISVVTVVA